MRAGSLGLADQPGGCTLAQPRAPRPSSPTTSIGRRSIACERTNLELTAVAAVRPTDDAVGEVGEALVAPQRGPSTRSALGGAA
jgi:hypothetical protein